MVIMLCWTADGGIGRDTGTMRPLLKRLFNTTDAAGIAVQPQHALGPEWNGKSGGKRGTGTSNKVGKATSPIQATPTQLNAGARLLSHHPLP